jgi:two-component system, NtrC family, sensor kinase
MSMVFLGFRYALIWTVISISTIIVFLILEAKGVPMPVRYNPTFDLMYRGLAWFGLSFIILIVINIFKNSEENAKKRLVQKNEELESTLETLKRTQEQLIHSEKLASLGQMTAGIAHEIQNPLNFIKNFSELSVELMDEVDKLKDEADMPGLIESLKSNLVKIKEHSARTDKIVKSMLEHSRIQQSEMTSTHVNTLCNEIIELAEQGLHGTGDLFDLKIQREYDPSNPSAKLVTHDTGRVLINLINNAIYSLKQQKKSNPDFIPVLSVSSAKENNRIVIRVKDNGPGIPTEIKKDIFKPFYTTKPTGEGTGLGLSISNNIIQSQNGTLELEESRPGNTVFKITFPVI